MADPLLPSTPVASGGLAAMSDPARTGSLSTSPEREMEIPSPAQLQALMGEGYVVEGFIGRGGMGAVYRGLQMPLRRPVAIKILARGHGADFDFEERFRREAYAMAQLTHPNIVQVYDFGTAGENFLFISMEFVECGDLHAALRAGWMTPHVALSLIVQICTGLQAAHEHGIVHRDIKPGNIFLTADCRAKVADFGLAKRFDDRSSIVTHTALGLGTPDYAAPEQYENLPTIDHRADVYSLGVMMYQMLTGQLPRGAWKPASDCAGTDARLDAVMLKAMAADPADRYQNAEAMKSDILHVMHTPLRRAGSVSLGPVARLPEGITLPVRVVRVEEGMPAAARRAGTGSPMSMSRPATPLPRRQAAPARRVATRPPAREGWVSGLIAGLVCTLIVACAIVLPSLEPAKGQSRPVELIDLNELKGVPLAGHWSASREGLQCKAPPARAAAANREDTRMRIYELRYSPPDEYDFEIEFTRTRGSIMHVLSAKGCTFVHELKPSLPDEPEVRSGFNGADGLRMEQVTEGYGLVAAPDDNSRHVVTVQVRHDMVRSLLDGKEVAIYRGDVSRLALPKPFRLGGDAGHLGIASRGGDVVFHRATVREISGPGKFTYPSGSLTRRGLTAAGTASIP